VPRYLLPVVAAGLLAAGCTSWGKPVESTTSAPATAAAVPILNVCDDLPDSALQAAGLDPSTEDVITNAPSGPTSWIVCAWDPADQTPATYRVELYSTSHTLAETRNNGDLIDFADATIGGREAITFKEKATTETRCRASFGAEQGSFVLSTAWFETGAKPDLCGLAVQYLTALEPALPE
jgi:hypothetical protein